MISREDHLPGRMASQYLAVRLGLMSLLSSHLPEIEQHCPALHSAPSPRVDQIPQALMQHMNLEVKQIDETEVSCHLTDTTARQAALSGSQRAREQAKLHFDCSKAC